MSLRSYRPRLLAASVAAALAIFATGTAVARMVGPALLTTVVLGWGSIGWLLVGGLFVVAGYAMGPAVRWAREKNSTSTGAAAEDLSMCV